MRDLFKRPNYLTRLHSPHTQKQNKNTFKYSCNMWWQYEICKQHIFVNVVWRNLRSSVISTPYFESGVTRFDPQLQCPLARNYFSSPCSLFDDWHLTLYITFRESYVIQYWSKFMKEVLEWNWLSVSLKQHKVGLKNEI